MKRSTSSGGVLVLAVHEHALPGNEDVVEDDHRLLAGELAVAGVDVAVHGAGVAGLAAVDVGDAGRVDRQGADDGVVLVRRPEAHRRHHDQPVRIDAAGLVRLGAADVEALVVAARDVHEEIRVGLLVGRLARGRP